MENRRDHVDDFCKVGNSGSISGTIESGYPISHSASFATLSRAQRVVVVPMNRSGWSSESQKICYNSTTTAIHGHRNRSLCS